MTILRDYVSKSVWNFIEILNLAVVELSYKPNRTAIRLAIDTLSKIRN